MKFSIEHEGAMPRTDVSLRASRVEVTALAAMDWADGATHYGAYKTPASLRGDVMHASYLILGFER